MGKGKTEESIDPRLGLRPKYFVCRIGSISRPTGPDMKATDPNDVDSPFVLMPRKDPAAFFALLTYAQDCEPDLGDEIREWLGKIAVEPIAYGTQGARNMAAMRLKSIRFS